MFVLPACGYLHAYIDLLCSVLVVQSICVSMASFVNVIMFFALVDVFYSILLFLFISVPMHAAHTLASMCLHVCLCGIH